MKLGLFILFLIIAVPSILLASSGCADPWIIGSESGKGGPLECSITTAQTWKESVESEGYVYTIDAILGEAVDRMYVYYDYYSS